MVLVSSVLVLGRAVQQALAFVLLGFLVGGPFSYLSAQSPKNLVPNPGFESFREMPGRAAQLYLAEPWFNPAGEVPPVSKYGTPDLFHRKAGPEVRTPRTKFGDITPFRGDALAGLILYNKYSERLVDFREYLCVGLLVPLQPGVEYEVQLHYATGTDGHYGKFATPNLQVGFVEDRPTQDGNEPLRLSPQCRNSSLKYAPDWQALTFSLQADRPYRFLCIGNFERDGKTPLEVKHTGNRAGPCAYVFVDEISVVAVSEVVAAEELDLGGDELADEDSPDSPGTSEAGELPPLEGTSKPPALGTKELATDGGTTEEQATKPPPRPPFPPRKPFRLNCPKDMVVAAETGLCHRRKVRYLVPEWSGPEGSQFTRVAGPENGSVLEVGDHTVRYRLEGPQGERIECAFRIRVEDREPPKLECPSDMEVKAPVGATSQVVLYPEPEAQDNCSPVKLTRLTGPPSEADYPLGTTQVIYQAQDASGNTAQCEFKVKIDGLPQSIDGETIAFQGDIITARSADLTIYYYDAQVKDQDIISINVDGEWVLQESRIKKQRGDFWKTDHLDLILEPDHLHYLIFQANDEGSIPPCTISLMIVDGEKNKVAERTVSFKIGESGGVALQLKKP